MPHELDRFLEQTGTLAGQIEVIKEPMSRSSPSSSS
jgi:hypothetical protein